MITKNLIVNQLPEYNNMNSKPIRGLATFSGGDSLSGNIKVFNIRDELLPINMVVKVGDKKFLFSDIDTPQNYDFRISGVTNDDDITLLLATNIDGVVSPLAMAHSATISPDYSALFDELSDKELDEIIERELDDSISNPAIQQEENDDNLSQRKTDEVEEEYPEPTGNFYSLIQPQLDELFAKFPHFRELEDLVANTEWIKVNYAPDDTQHYILGKLFDGEVVTHLCYGIPASSRATAPPESLVDYCQWLPLKLSEPDGAGYWVMYQSAETGENIRL